MRRLLPLIAVVVFSLPVLAGGCADEKLPPRPQSRKNATAAAKGAAAPKPRVQVFTGTIVAVDETAGTLTLKGAKAEKAEKMEKAPEAAPAEKK